MVNEHPSPGGAVSIWFVDGFFDAFARSSIRGVASRDEGGISFSKGRFVMFFAKGKNARRNESRCIQQFLQTCDACSMVN